jgi:hypothetical protein
MIADGWRAERARGARTMRLGAAARRACPRASLAFLLAASTPATPAQGETGETARARQPIEPRIEELFLGELASPQEQLELQITSAPAWQREGRRVEFSVPLLLELGVTDRLQIGGELPLALVRHDSGVAAGLGEVEAEIQYNLLDDRALGLCFSAGFAAVFPAGARELGAPGYALEPFVRLDKALGRVHLSLSASAEVRLPVARGDAAEVGPGAALGAAIPAGALVPTVELAAELDEGTPLLLFAPGVLWHPARGFELGAALGVGLTDEAPDVGLLLLVTRELDLAGEDEDLPKHASRSRAP